MTTETHPALCLCGALAHDPADDHSPTCGLSREDARAVLDATPIASYTETGIREQRRAMGLPMAPMAVETPAARLMRIRARLASEELSRAVRAIYVLELAETLERNPEL